MINFLKIAFIWVLLCAAPIISIAQNFNNIFDIDSSNNIGNDIFLEQDGSFIVLGDKLKYSNIFSAVKFSASGNTINHENTFNINGASCYTGYVARKKKLSSGEFLMPFNIIWPRPNLDAESGGYAILDKDGIVEEHHDYNSDTAHYLTAIFDCIQLPDGGYLCGGISVKRATRFAVATLIRTNDTGKMLWQKDYPYFGYQTHINSLQLIDANTILAGGCADEQLVIKSAPAVFARPRFLKLDLSGNILKDTTLITGYAGIGQMGNGNIFKDRSGGYYHYGQLEKIYDSTHLDWSENFPDYLMHLDDNFKIDWVTKFEDTPGHKYIWTVRQLNDNNYLVLNNLINDTGYFGWAAKVDRNGFIIWDKKYYHAINGKNYLTDAVELSDGSIVFTGYAADLTLPAWHVYDLWMLKVEANGCEVPGCMSTGIITHLQPNEQSIKIYPNPVDDQLNIEGLSKGCTIQVMDMFGRQVYNNTATGNVKTVNMSTLPPAGYVVNITDPNGSRTVRKVIKQ